MRIGVLAVMYAGQGSFVGRALKRQVEPALANFGGMEEGRL